MTSGLQTLNRMLGTERLHCFDVGARGGIQANWRPFASILELNAFEPDEAACRLQQEVKRANESWFPVALGPETGTAKFHVVHKASSSSLLPPNPAASDPYDFAKSRVLARVVDVPTISVSDFLDRYQRPLPNLMKLDTQGTELSILRGMEERHWRDLLAVQSEFHFVEFYLGEPLFHDLDAFMRSRGFMMFDMLLHRKYRTDGRERHHYLRKHFGIARNRHDISARATGGDVFYIRPPERVLDDANPVEMARMLAILLMYRCLDEALWFVTEAQRRALVSAAEAGDLFGLIRGLAPEARPWQKTGAIGKWSRKLLRWSGISRRRRKEFWMDRSWDH
jgi:FkbM family methyltransferase